MVARVFNVCCLLLFDCGLTGLLWFVVCCCRVVLLVCCGNVIVVVCLCVVV